jgi:hypothetical protein
MIAENLITAEELAGPLKMAAEGMKKPGLMNSSAAADMELVHEYDDRVAKPRQTLPLRRKK